MEKRKKLGGTPMNTLKTQESEVNQKVGKKGDRAGYLTIDKGWNKFRYFPAHPGTESFMCASVKYFVPFIDEDGKLKKRSVFNSKVHGNTEKDLIEEYLKFLTEETLSHLEGPALDAALKPLIFGGDYNLQAQTQWIGYANKYDNKGKKVGFGRLAITPGTKNKLEKLSSTEGSDEPIEVDPFSDEEDGIAVILTYDPDAKDNKGKRDMKNFYNVELEKKKTSKFGFELVPTPLDEKEIEEFLKLETLESMFKNCYQITDFNIALTGLQIIDKECKFGVLKDTRFLEIVEEIKNYYPEDEEQSPEEPAEVKEENGDDLTSMDRNTLKRTILNEFGQGIIIVRQNMSDDDIRELIRAKRKELAESVPEAEEALEEEPAPEETPQSDLPFDQGTQSDSLKKMREKMEARKAAAKK